MKLCIVCKLLFVVALSLTVTACQDLSTIVPSINDPVYFGRGPVSRGFSSESGANPQNTSGDVKSISN